MFELSVILPVNIPKKNIVTLFLDLLFGFQYFISYLLLLLYIQNIMRLDKKAWSSSREPEFCCSFIPLIWPQNLLNQNPALPHVSGITC